MFDRLLQLLKTLPQLIDLLGNLPNQRVYPVNRLYRLMTHHHNLYTKCCPEHTRLRRFRL
jgi:hypothetical protein